jgi:hypothetical protein
VGCDTLYVSIWPAGDLNEPRSADISGSIGEGPEPNFLPPDGWDPPLWKSLLANTADTFSPERQPPLQLHSRPVDLGMPLGDRLRTPWYRTVFTNLGDVLSPEVLPPLELESQPIDVGELLVDQLSHLWISSFLRNLADVVAPERQVPLQLSSKPDPAVLADSTILLPRWSSVIDGPKAYLTDPTKAAYSPAMGRAPAPPPLPPEPPAILLEFLHDMHSDLRRDLRRSRLRARVWMALAGAQVLFLLGSLFWPH